MIVPNINLNHTSPKGDYGEVWMSLKSSRTQQKTAIKAQSPFPQTFEALGQDSGLILYESIIKNILPDPAKGNI